MTAAVLRRRCSNALAGAPATHLPHGKCGFASRPSGRVGGVISREAGLAPLALPRCSVNLRRRCSNALAGAQGAPARESFAGFFRKTAYSAVVLEPVWTVSRTQAPVAVSAVLMKAVSRMASPFTGSKAMSPETPV